LSFETNRVALSPYIYSAVLKAITVVSVPAVVLVVETKLSNPVLAKSLNEAAVPPLPPSLNPHAKLAPPNKLRVVEVVIEPVTVGTVATSSIKVD
jgi:hypothetical protein